MLVRTLTDKALLITASKVRYKKANTKFLAKFIYVAQKIVLLDVVVKRLS